MKKVTAIFAAAALFLSISCPGILFSEEESSLISKIREAKDYQASLDACKEIIGQCKTYDDYEKMIEELKNFIAKQKDYKYPSALYYAIGKARLDELSYLINKNDIDSGRIYMSFNDKYYNEAQEFLGKADQSARSKDMSLDIYLLKFSIFKERLQPEKAQAVFDEIVNLIASYSTDKAANLAKLNEMSKKFSDKGMADYAMKLKFAYASKVDPESAKMLADEIRASADRYFEEGSRKEALSTYDTYLELAERYYDKDAMATKLMDISEKYFDKKRYKDAIKYYSLYISKYGGSQVADYASYKLALSYYSDKDYANAIAKFDEFLKTYQNSVWFENGSENLARLYYETSDTDKAVDYLQKLIDTYPRRDTMDYAYLLIGILYYSKSDYDKALEVFKKIRQFFPKSAYFYTTETLIKDIGDIKKGAAPSYSFGSKDVYKLWEPYTPIGLTVTVGEGAQVVDSKDAKPGELFIKTKSGSKVTFNISGIEDLDRFNEYWQDKEDASRLPREIKAGTEKDLILFAWSCADNGKFLDDKQASSRAWQAPDAPGDYIISINVGDIALVRPPDSGTRKDNPKTLNIHVNVEK